MIPGYNTNGLPHHRAEDAVRLLADVGYRSVALTLDHDLMRAPDRSAVDEVVARMAPVIETTGMRVTIETGARYLLDSRRKHRPNLLEAHEYGREARIEFYLAAIDIAAGLGADGVSLWSGARPADVSVSAAWHHLEKGLRRVLDHAATRGVSVCFEPEPGMFIETMDQASRLFDLLGHGSLALTLDVGHLHCLDDGDTGEQIEAWHPLIRNVHLEDMRRGRHEHLMFAEGEMRFEPIFAALRRIDYRGPLHVELSRHGHMAVEAVQRSMDFLRSHGVG